MLWRQHVAVLIEDRVGHGPWPHTRGYLLSGHPVVSLGTLEQPFFSRSQSDPRDHSHRAIAKPRAVRRSLGLHPNAIVPDFVPRFLQCRSNTVFFGGKSVVQHGTSLSVAPPRRNEALSDTLTYLEQDAQTRVNHARGVMSLQKTGNIVGASWLHTTSRPVDGWPDPNLHVHCFVINATHTGNRWTAVDLSSVVRDSGFYEAIFQSRLAENIVKLGYPVSRNAKDFEIEGVSRQTIDKFSRRTAVIEEAAKAGGITNAKEKGSLGAKTRDKKSTSEVPVAELPAKWQSVMNGSERSLFGSFVRSKGKAGHVAFPFNRSVRLCHKKHVSKRTF